MAHGKRCAGSSAPRAGLSATPSGTSPRTLPGFYEPCCGPSTCSLDDVVAKLSPHRLPARLAHVEGEGRLLEGLDHLSPAEAPQVAAPLAAGAGAVLLRQLAEVGPRLNVLHPLQ